MHSTMASANRFRFPVCTRFVSTAWRYSYHWNSLIHFCHLESYLNTFLIPLTGNGTKWEESCHLPQVQKGLPAARRRSCHRSAHKQLCNVHSAPFERQKILVIFKLNHFIFESSNLVSSFWLLSFWCLTCDAVPEPSCHDSHHIVLDRSKDVDELCTLLLVCATFSSDVVTLRERLQSNLQLELEGLQEKEEKEAVELLMAENSSCLVKRLLMDSWAALKWQSPSVIRMAHIVLVVKKEPQKGHRRAERRVDSSWRDAAHSQSEGILQNSK